MMRLKTLVLTLSALAVTAFVSPAVAAWPNDKPIVIVTPWQAGSGIDLLTRLVAEGLAKKWNNQVTVENRPGASGNIGQAFVAKAEPDGYTFLMTTPGPAANNMLTFKSLPYNPLVALLEPIRPACVSDFSI